MLMTVVMLPYCHLLIIMIIAKAFENRNDCKMKGWLLFKKFLVYLL